MSRSPGSFGSVSLRAPRRRDGPAWVETRVRDQDWLEPWEAVPPAAALVPWAERQTTASWAGTLRVLRRQARHGQALPLVVLVGGRFVGQVTVAQVVRGALESASVGYWVDSRLAGRGVGTVAVALAVDHAFSELGLHRVEAAVRPENVRSRALLARLGFREEGALVRSLFADGAWRDHLVCGLTVEEVPAAGMLSRLPRDTPARLPGPRDGGA